MREHQEHHAELAEVGGVAGPRRSSRARAGPIATPDDQVAEERRQAESAEHHDDEHRAREQDENQFERVAHGGAEPPLCYTFPDDNDSVERRPTGGVGGCAAPCARGARNRGAGGRGARRAARRAVPRRRCA